MSFIALFCVSCATKGPDIRMLEQVADYEGDHQATEVTNQFAGPLFSPKRTAAQTADIYVHGHELPTGDFFMGGKIRVLVAKSRWHVEQLPRTAKKRKKKRVTGKLKEKERRAKKRLTKNPTRKLRSPQEKR